MSKLIKVTTCHSYPFRRIGMTIIAMMIWGCGLCSEPKNSINVMGSVFDAVTELPLKNAKITIRDSLGVVLVDSIGYEISENYRSAYEIVRYEGTVPEHDKYQVTISAKGYQTEEFDVEKKSVIFSGEKVSFVELGAIYLRRPQKEHRLNEVTVTATKVKMVMKGDTLEYDATAFQLPEGSMLDNLIRELPGAQLDDNGRITVNGQFVDQLLVNGRKFFQGDPQVALRNLPAFTVKNVQVYRREPEEFRGRNIERDKSNDPLVMDVNLKKEYMGGWLANGEIGGGTSLKNAWDTRWMGRLFAMRYTKLNYLALHASANNLNDPAKAGSKGQWYKPQVSAGETTTKRAGIEFNTDWADQSNNGINTTFNIVRQTSLTGQTAISEQFMEGGNTFSRSKNSARRSSWSIDWGGEISRRFDRIGRIWFRTDINFDKGTGRRTSSSAESNSMLPENFTAPGSIDFAQDMLYYRSQSLLSRDQKFGVKSRLLFNLYCLPSKYGSAGIEIQGAHNNSRVSSESSDLIIYPNALNRDINLLQHDLAPSRDYNFSISPSWDKYRIALSETKFLNLRLGYQYEQKYNLGRRSLEEMNLQESDSDAPSMSESGSWFLDEANSYHTTRREWNNGINAYIAYSFGGKYGLSFSGTSTYSIRRLTDFRMQTMREVARNDWKNSARIKFDYGDYWTPGLSWGFDGNFYQELPDMLKMLDVRDSSNPMVTNLGNPNLKRAKTYTASAYIRHKKTTGLKTQFDLSAGWSKVDDALAMARTYNRETGVTTWQPANINGNWTANIKLETFSFLTRNNNLEFNNSFIPRFRHNVDYSSDSDIPVAVAVNSWTIRDDFRLSYNFSADFKLNAKVNVSWTQMKSLDGLFLPFDYLDINYGIGGRAKIPGEVYIDTDLMAYCRRGYGDATMNRTDWVWNLEISKSFGSAKEWTVKAIGFDLLQQLPTVQRTLNAQGRSEIRLNSQPAYALLTLSYRLDIKPKRK